MASKKYDVKKAILDNLPPPDGEPIDYWEKNLELNERHRIVPSLRNAYVIISSDARWSGVLSSCKFSNQVVKRKPPPFEGSSVGPWSDDDDLRAIVWLAHHYRVNFDKRAVMDATELCAGDHPMHPVKEYLTNLTWDRMPRLGNWLADYLGAPKSDYTGAVGTKWMVGAVARVYRPGCKMDNVLILEGPQGRWKSTALKVLAGEDWFGDTPFTIGDKDSFLVIRGKLIYELAELDGFTRAESSRAKSFFSSTADTYVPKYVARAVKVPRQIVFAGTVNHGTYLRDATGNRRYWPVRVDRADLERLAADRDQLWAEAVHAHLEHVPWWVEEHERELFECEQELRYVGDAFEDRLRLYLADQSQTTMEKVLSEGLRLEVSKWTRAEQTRVGEVLHKIGFEKTDRGSAAPKGHRYFYRRREREPGEEG